MPRAVVNPEDQIYYVCTMYYYLVLCSSKKESKVIHRAYNLETHTHTHTHTYTVKSIHGINRAASSSYSSILSGDGDVN